MNLTVMILLLVGLVVSAAACICLQNLLKASIAMAVTSAILSIVMFQMNAPLAAVLELSVCAGLITVIFISAISMTKLNSKEETHRIKVDRRKRYALLPVLLIVTLAGALILIWPQLNELIPRAAVPMSSAIQSDVFWNKRQTDLLGQIVIVLAGVYGVLIFFKEKKEGEE